ncbi:hypothetical protein EDB83DRAFT_2555893 [Lactarius deliciosus]|nr:hypothetical protein EDB83DRAFT_2555893 [Lactarius deliciosus]
MVISLTVTITTLGHQSPQARPPPPNSQDLNPMVLDARRSLAYPRAMATRVISSLPALTSSPFPSFQTVSSSRVRLALVARAFPNGIDFFTSALPTQAEPSATRAPTAITAAAAAAMGGVPHTTTITDREDRYDNDYDSRENETARTTITIAIAATLVTTTTTTMMTTTVAASSRSTQHQAVSAAHHHAAAAIDKTGKIILPMATALNARLHVLKQEGPPQNPTYPPAKPLRGAWIGATNSCDPMRPARAPRHSDGPYAAGNHLFLSNNVLRDRHGHITHNPGPLSLDESGSDFEDDAADDNDNRTATTATATMVASGSGDDTGEGGSGRTSTYGGLHGGDRGYYFSRLSN